MIESKEITENKERLKKCLQQFPYKRQGTWKYEGRFWYYANELRKLGFDLIGDYSTYSNEFIGKKYGLPSIYVNLLPSVSDKFKKGKEYHNVLQSKILRKTIPSRVNNLEINFV